MRNRRTYLYVASKRLADEEQGLKPIYREQCGGIVNLRVSKPFVRLAVYKKFLVAACGLKRYVMRFDDIQDISVQRHFGARSIRIRHYRTDIPKPFVI